MSGPRGQHGFLVIVAAVLIVIVGFLGVAVTFLISANMRASTDNYDAARALFVADAGLEYGTYDWSMNGNTGPSTQNFGAGSFTFFADDNGSAFGLGNPLANPNQKRIVSTGGVGNASRTVEAIVEGALGGGGGIAYDARSSRGRTNTNNLSWNHGVGAAGVNRILVVGVSIRTSTVTVTGVTYAGNALFRASNTVPGVTNGGVRVELWYRLAPVTGNNPVVVSLSGGVTAVVGGAVSFTGVDQTNPFDNFTTIVGPAFGVNYSQGTGNLATVQVTTTSDNAWVMDTVALRQNANANQLAGQTRRWNRRVGNNANNRVRGAGSHRGPVSPAAPVTMGWNFNRNRAWVMGAVALKPAPVGFKIIAWREVFP